MANVPRRRVLLAAASGVTALAGCAGSETASNSVPSRTHPIGGYELETARDESGDAIVTGDEQVPSPADGERARRRRRARRVLVADGDLSALEFAETAAADRLRSFLAATDFESASAYLLTMPVEACRELRLRSVGVEPDELADGDLHPRADFCRAYRPADFECDPEAVHTVGFAIRLPVAADRSSGSGTGTRNSCRRESRPTVFNASAASDAGGDDA